MKKFLLAFLIYGIFQLGLQAQSDNCAGAAMLSAAQLNCATTGQSLTGDTGLFTTADGVNYGGCVDGTTNPGVWYRFTAQGPDIEILNNGGGADPYVMIFENTCPPLVADQVYCDQLDILDDDMEGDDLLVTGTIYLIWIGFDGPAANYNVCVTNPPAPVNDLCVNAQLLTTAQLNCMISPGSTTTGTTEFAGPDGFDIIGCIDAGSNSWEGVWYTFVAQGEDMQIDDVTGNSPYVVIMDDCNIATANLIHCTQLPFGIGSDPDGIDNELILGQQYWIWVGFDGGNEEAFEICVDNRPYPVNDLCMNAINIDDRRSCIINGEDPIVGDIYGATPDFTFGCLPNSGQYDGIWYSFTVQGHDLLIESSGNEDPYIAILSECAGGTTLLYCGQTPIDLGTDNDAIPGEETNNFITLDLIGTTLYMWVGFDNGLDSTFNICFENPPPPMNDLCDNSELLEGEQLACIDGDVPVLGTTNYSSWYANPAGPPANFQYQMGDYVSPPGIFNTCFDPDEDEVVHYRFTAPGPDLEISDVMGNNPSFALFEWNDCMQMPVFILCDEMPFSFDDDDPDDLFHEGFDYLMMVGFPGGWQSTDSFELCINIPEPPANNLCENAEIIGPDRLDCPDFPKPVIGHTTNSSQQGMFWTNLDPFVDLDCQLDTTNDDGVWYRFTAIGTDLEITDNLGNNPTILLMSFDPCIADTFSPVFCAQPPISSDFGQVGNNACVIGEEYLMFVTFQGGESESDTFELCIDNEGMCSSPPPPNSWCQTTPICGLSALDAYCLNMQNDNMPSESFPGCANSLDNPNWFSFVAGATNLSIQVQVGDCSVGTGIQVGMYEIDCTLEIGPNQPFCPASAPGLGPLLTGCATISTEQLSGTVVQFDAMTEFGHIYAIVIDGWGQSLCQIEVNVVLGADPPSLDGVMLTEPEWDPTAFPFEGDTICAGAEDVRFAVAEEVPGACRYDWTVDGVPVPDGTNDIEEFIDFPDPGTYEVCFYASNFCDSTDPVCITIVVSALLPFIVNDTICEGDIYVWTGPFDEILPFDPAFTSDEGGDYVYTALAVNAAGCEVDAFLNLHVREENDDNRTPLDTVICADNAPLEIFGNIVPINTSGEGLNFEFDAQIAHGGQCDSFFRLDAFQLEAIIFYDVIPPDPLIQVNVSCQDSVITVCPTQIAGNPFITPDPNVYPDLDIHYTWLTVPFGDTVGTDDVCLTVHFDDFENTGASGQEFEVVVSMSKGGRPAGGCIFGPFELEIVRPQFIPDVEVLGPDTVCVGPDYAYSLLPFFTDDNDVAPSPTGYLWDLSGFPGAIRTEVDQLNSSFTFGQRTVGQICVTATHPCSNGPVRCKTVVVSGPPVPAPGDDAEECTNTYTLGAGNPSGIWFTDDGPLGAMNPVFGDNTDPNSSVTITTKGEYTFGWVTEGYGCSDTAYVDIDFIEPMALGAAPMYTCDAVNENFTVTFDFVGGIAPFVVTSLNGTLIGQTFTSDPIPEGDTVLILITDDQGCTGSFPVTFDCACITEGAMMNLNQIASCGEVCVNIVPATPPVLDDNDIAVFILHTNPGNTLGTVIAENTTGQFCYTAGGPILYDVEYYVSIIVGNERVGTVDLDARCTDIAPGQPVIWYDIPAPDAGADDATCAKIYDLTVANNNYPGSWEVISAGTNVTFADQNSPNTTLTALGCGVVELQWVEGNGPAATPICFDTTLVTIEFFCNPTFGTLNFTCNMDQTELIVTFPLNGVGPFTETNGRGQIIGSEFEVMGLPLLMADTFFFVDGNGCELIVPVPGADCNCLPIIMPDTICGLSLQLLSDGTGNGGFWTVSSTPTGETAVIADVNARSTNVTVSEYGIYCFEWTEVGTLCQGTGEICIPFVKAPEVDMSSIMYTCNSNYDGYTITFDIFDGNPASYRVFDENGLPLGSIIGNTFTSREFPSTQPVAVFVTDGFNCDTVELPLEHDCGCFTAPGDIDVAPLNLCADGQSAVIYDDANEMMDGNDVKIYILYSDIADPYNSVIAQNQTGVFAFMDPPMVIGTTYYVSAVLGTESPLGSGQIDFTDPCVVITAPLPVTWYDATVPSIAKSQIEFTCLITDMILTVSASGDINDYDIEWTTTDGSIEPGDENMVNAQINAPGTYTVILRHSIAGCPSMATIVVDQSDDVPEAQIAVPLSITCARDEVNLSGDGSDTGPAIRYEWSGPGIVGQDTTLNITVNQTGEYILTLIDESNGCRISQTVTVFDDLLEPTAIANSPNLLDCNTTEVTVVSQGSSSGPNFTYQWSVITPGGNIIGSTTGPTIVSDETGTYQLLVTNLTNGCTNTVNVVVRADDSVISGANISVQQPGCGGEDDGQITFASIIGGTGPFMYSFNGGADFDVVPGMSDLAAGVYDLIVTDANGCEFTEQVILTQPFDFTIELGETILIELGDTAYLNGVTNLPDSLLQSIFWSPLFDTANQFTYNQTFVPDDYGQQSIILTVTNSNGCVEQDDILVVVKFAEKIYIPNAMNPLSTNGENQRIYIFADPETVTDIHSFAIYNRWGERMFQRTDLPVTLDYDPDYAWDGMWEGELAPADVYVYYTEVEFVTGVRKLIKGDFTLVR